MCVVQLCEKEKSDLKKLATKLNSKKMVLVAKEKSKSRISKATKRIFLGGVVSCECVLLFPFLEEKQMRYNNKGMVGARRGVCVYAIGSVEER